jgi:hypothetical protein
VSVATSSSRVAIRDLDDGLAVRVLRVHIRQKVDRYQAGRSIKSSVRVNVGTPGDVRVFADRREVYDEVSLPQNRKKQQSLISTHAPVFRVI